MWIHMANIGICVSPPFNHHCAAGLVGRSSAAPRRRPLRRQRCFRGSLPPPTGGPRGSRRRGGWPPSCPLPSWSPGRARGERVPDPYAHSPFPLPPVRPAAGRQVGAANSPTGTPADRQKSRHAGRGVLWFSLPPGQLFANGQDPHSICVQVHGSGSRDSHNCHASLGLNLL